MAFERITIDHNKMGGLPCIRDLRIPVSTVLGQLAAGRDAREILDDFPDLGPEDILAALEYAAAAVQELLLDSNLSHRVAQLLRDAGVTSRHWGPWTKSY